MKIQFIIKTLNTYFPSPKIPLYHENAFTLLIAILLSQNSRDKMVNKVTPILFKKADTPKKMSLLKKSTIEKIIKPVGLGPSKATAILELSHILVKKYHSKIPNTFEELEKLPKIGHKTASCILCYAFSKDTFPVDTHVFRCARRWGLSKEKRPEKVEEDLKRIFPKKLWKKLHIQMVLFGRKYCKAIGHKKNDCPICKHL